MAPRSKVHDARDPAFLIRKRRGAGNALVSQRDLAAQELILSEYPVVVCPQLTAVTEETAAAAAVPICALCFLNLTSTAHLKCCSLCKRTFCSENCASLHNEQTRNSSSSLSDCSVVRRIKDFFPLDGDNVSCQEILFALGVVKVARLRKRRSPKVSDLMTRDNESMKMTPREVRVAGWLGQMFRG